jgi:hypothetical protein
MVTMTGELANIKETEKISDTFSKREFVLMENSGNFPNPLPMQLIKDKCGLLDGFKEGEEVDVTFYLQGNMPEATADKPQRAFVNLTVTKIKRSES